jgi:hypothetical protein
MTSSDTKGERDLVTMTAPKPAKPRPWLEPGELEPIERRAVALVASCRSAHGCGPTWRELSTALGMTAAESRAPIFGARLQWLRRGGWLTFDVSPRSLALGPAALAYLGRRP